MRPPQSARRGFAGLVAASVAAAGLAVFAAPAASADTAVDGSGDWGVKESFRNYVGGPIAEGSVTPSEGASANEDGTFSWPVDSGTADPDSGEFTVRFGGTVVFEGHDYGDGPELQLSLNDPRVEFDGGEGTLFADVTSKALDDGAMVDYPDVALATLAVPDAEVTGDRIVWEDIPASLTADGVPAFADFYMEAEQLDPVTITLTTSEDDNLWDNGDDNTGPEGGGAGGGGLPKTGPAILAVLLAAVVVTAVGAAMMVRRRKITPVDAG